jgi:hypothetical protein
MSQVDKLNYLPLLFWFFICLFIFYFLIFTFILPLIFGSLKVRGFIYFWLLSDSFGFHFFDFFNLIFYLSNFFFYLLRLFFSSLNRRIIFKDNYFFFKSKAFFSPLVFRKESSTINVKVSVIDFPFKHPCSPAI